MEVVAGQALCSSRNAILGRTYITDTLIRSQIPWHILKLQTVSRPASNLLLHPVEVAPESGVGRHRIEPVLEVLKFNLGVIGYYRIVS